MHSLQAHLVFVPKYRRAVISERVFQTLRSAWEQVCADFACELHETGWESDHVHLLVGYPPKVALSRLINSLKGVSARRLRAANFQVSQLLRGVLWRSPARDREALCPETARRGFLPALKGRVSAPGAIG